jgi:hypothetical protein
LQVGVPPANRFIVQVKTVAIVSANQGEGLLKT